MDIVSVIVPCYNQALYLEEAIESVLFQSYNHWECIIVNDGSTDNTEEVALKFVNKDSRISYYRKLNGGLSSARNFGIDKSKGKYILPLDGDDKIHSSYLEKALKVFDEKNVKVVYCETEYFDAKKGKFELPEYSQSELARMNMIVCSAVYRKSDFIGAGGYNINMKFGWEDWDLWISILKNGGNVFKIPESLFYYRIKKESMLLSLEGSKKQKMFMQLYLNHPDFFDQYYKEPIDIFPEYKDLKNYINTFEDRINFLKGIIRLKPSSFKLLGKKMHKKFLIIESMHS